ncbi:MAG: hypothetical protein GWN46_20045, partial [Gammaproteobacteria bacterium]|nr:hypothetical protein [Gammaproteobacteria bacterium]
NGPDAFTVSVTDDDGNVETQVITLTVNPLNDLPVATANTVSTTEDNAYAFSVADFTFTDVENDALVSATIANLSLAGGTLEHSGGVAVTDGSTLSAAEIATLVYTPPGDASGAPLATFDFTVNDADPGVTAARMDIEVTPVNDPPVITSDGGGATAAVSIDENTSAVTTVTSTDVDGGAPAYSISGGADLGFFGINTTTGDLFFLAPPDFENALDSNGDNVYEVQVTVADGAGGFDVQDISVTVNDISNNLVVTTELDVVDAVDFSSAEALNANKGADGLVSLAEAILAANGNTDFDTITFNIGGGGPFTISPGPGGLPAIINPVEIDATTQPGFAGDPIIELDGSLAGAADGFSLAGGSDGSTIRGFVINRFEGNGISILSSNNRIEGNWIGTDVTGTLAGFGNQGEGVLIFNPATNNVIGGTTAAQRNVIAGNQWAGVYIVNSDNNFVRGNYIGIDALGSTAIANGLDGVEIFDGIGNTIGGSVPGSGNVISGNTEDGVSIHGFRASANRMLGNIIGLDATGTTSVANQWNGVAIQFDASNNIVGGTAPNERNVISGNTLSGVFVQLAAGNRVLGNYIGTDITGLDTPLSGNQQDGVRIVDGVNNTIGGVNPGEGNVISGNLDDGVAIEGVQSMDNRVQGNIIGLNKDAD